MSEGEVPKLFHQCISVYGWMLEDAEEKREGVFWTGALTNLLTENGIGVGHYTHLTQKLIAMGCIEQVQRGAATTPSIWCMLQAPTLELFNSSASKSTSGTRLNKRASRDQAVQSLSERISKLELLVTKIVERLKDDNDAR